MARDAQIYRTAAAINQGAGADRNPAVPGDNLHHFARRDAVALAPRTFARRVAATCGVSPIQFVQRIRLETARLLLETTRLPVDEIARRVGYAEPSTLRRLIRRNTKHPPGHFRPAA